MAEIYILGRSIEQTKETLFDMFYENAEQQGYAAERAKNHVRHSHKMCNQYIEDDDYLEGTIDNLTSVGTSAFLTAKVTAKVMT